MHNDMHARSKHLRDTLSVSYTLTQKIACLERELRFRFRVYPRRVARGTMSQNVALYEIDLMKEIIEDYRKRREPELEL
jgi:hypothetical protein